MLCNSDTIVMEILLGQHECATFLPPLGEGCVNILCTVLHTYQKIFIKEAVACVCHSVKVFY